MPARPALSAAIAQQLFELGERLRVARLRRNLTATEVSERAGITRVTLHSVEIGDGSVTLGTYAKVLDALGLAYELAHVALDAGAGPAPADVPPRRRGTTAPRRIRLAKYPQLRQIAWNRDPNAELGPTEAFNLYERNWRHVDQGALEPQERELVDKLTQTVGKGVMLV